jgi:N-acetylglutamate synthase-like GNAT family acetyltransferase
MSTIPEGIFTPLLFSRTHNPSADSIDPIFSFFGAQFKIVADEPMSEEINIRQATINDTRSILKLVHSTIDISYHNIYPPEALAAFKNYHSREHIIRDITTGYTVVAERSKEIIGTGSLYEANIIRVFINPFNQQHGLGGLIALELEKKARLQGLSKLDLSASLVSVNFWKRIGFKMQKKSYLIVENGKKLYYYDMTKRLD